MGANTPVGARIKQKQPLEGGGRIHPLSSFLFTGRIEKNPIKNQNINHGQSADRVVKIRQWFLIAATCPHSTQA
jgi:hypothetical protein